MERPNRVLGKVLYTLQGNLDVAVRSGTIVWPILVTFQLYGEGERGGGGRKRGERGEGREEGGGKRDGKR